MTSFQAGFTIAFACWTILVVVRYRRSIPMLMGGLLLAGLAVLIAGLNGWVTADQLGLAMPKSLWITVGLAAAWSALMFVYSPIADWVATQFVTEPPDLEAFRALQESKAKLIAGIIVAWILGGFLEELIVRGMVLTAIESWLGQTLDLSLAAGIAIVVAAIGAGALHLYQGQRAVIIVTQLSVLFGVLFIVSGRNLWAVILCHGFYDTIAFILFARKASKYSNLDGSTEPPSDPTRFPMPSKPAIGGGIAAACFVLVATPALWESEGHTADRHSMAILFWFDRAGPS